MKQPINPKNAADHFASSDLLEVGGGIALLNFFSSIWNPGTAQAYAQ